MWVNFSISENEYLNLSKQTKSKEMIIPKYDDFDVEIVLADGSVYPQKGKLMFADPSFSLETGTFLVRAQVNNKQGLLKPGEFVRVHMKGAIRPNAVTIPRGAVLEGAKGNFVWVIKDKNEASVRQITLGQWVGNDVIVISGLFAGDKVVVDGFQKLSEGQKVDKISEVAASGNNTQNPPPAKTR
jgi:membrane fusion protein (multidrug efflux system)